MNRTMEQSGPDSGTKTAYHPALDPTQSTPNHTIDAATGFLESNAYSYAFDADRKLAFLSLFKANGLGLYRTCREMGLSHHTVNKAVKEDPAFREAFERVQSEYLDDLEAKSRSIALTNDKATLERIFQLRALKPEKYARDQMRDASPNINITVTGDLVFSTKKRSEALDTSIVREIAHAPIANPSQIHDSPSETRSSTEERTTENGARP